MRRLYKFGMNTFLRTKADIGAWLHRHGITGECRLTPNYRYGFVVDFMGPEVRLRNFDLSNIPVKFNTVQGHFDCSGNKLGHLEFAPVQVFGDFRCDGNKLVDLKGSPIMVSGDLDCSNNTLASLEGMSAQIGGDAHLHSNCLENLNFLSSSLEKSIFIHNNPLLAHLQQCTSAREIKSILGLKRDVQFERLLIEAALKKAAKSS